MLLLSACSRPREIKQIVKETVLVPQTVVVRETVVVQVTPTPDLGQGPITLNLALDGEPTSIDPALASGSEAQSLVANLFWGLTGVDGAGNVIPALATAWSASADGLTWTFTLRDDVNWVKIGPGDEVMAVGPVVAGDAAYAVQRVCDPRTGAPQADLDYVIAGCEELHRADLSGRSQADVQALVDGVGVRAVDDYTLEVTLDAPAGYFPAIAGLALNRPVPRAVIEALGDRWTEAGYLVSSGSYALAEWVHGDRLVLARNPLWPGWATAPGNVERVELAVMSDAATALDLYRQGKLDAINLPPGELNLVQADAVLNQELALAPAGCTEYVGFTHSQPPMDNPLVRRALSAAIDRQALVQQATPGGETPAHTFAPTTVFGNAVGDASIAPWAVPEAQGGWDYARALEQARAWLAEAGYAGGQSLPPITLASNNSVTRLQVVQAVQAMWQAGLGVPVTVQPLAWTEYLATLQGDNPPAAWLLGHCGDYADQHAWLTTVFNTNVGADSLRWAVEAKAAPASGGPSFDELTEAAAASADPSARRALYTEAERVLNDASAAYAPLYHYTTATVTKPYVQRPVQPPGSHEYQSWTMDWPTKRAAAIKR